MFQNSKVCSTMYDNLPLLASLFNPLFKKALFMNNKNMLHDRIDIFFLLNQKQIVTRNELYNLLPLQNYEEYQTSFYKRKLSDIFLRNYSSDWFVNGYLKGRTLKKHTFDVAGGYLVIQNVSNYHTEQDLNRILETVDGFKGLTLFTPDPSKGFRRDCYVRMEGQNVEGKYEEIRTKLNDYKLEFNYVQVGESEAQTNQKVDLKDIINVTKGICSLYSTSLAGVEELYGEPNSNTIEYYVGLLKHIFLYNFYTAQLFHSPLEFTVKESKFIGDEGRRRELATEYNNFYYVKNMSEDFLVGKSVERMGEGVFRCIFCDKKFESEDFVNLHQNNKHSNELQERKTKYEAFSLFISNLDVFILNLAEGSLDPTPWFIKKRDEQTIVYDMNHVFSGEIKMY